jgi:hypothetical protein
MFEHLSLIPRLLNTRAMPSLNKDLKRLINYYYYNNCYYYDTLNCSITAFEPGTSACGWVLSVSVVLLYIFVSSAIEEFYTIMYHQDLIKFPKSMKLMKLCLNYSCGGFSQLIANFALKWTGLCDWNTVGKMRKMKQTNKQTKWTVSSWNEKHCHNCSSGMAEWLTRRTNNLRISKCLGSNPASGKPLFLWASRFVTGTDLRVCL